MDSATGPESGRAPQPLIWDVDVALRRARTHGSDPALTPPPERARMLVLAPDDSALLAILRTRPGRDPYAVLPGGGLEPEDLVPLAGALRELEEETGLLEHDIDLLTSSVFVEREQWIHLARARRRPALHLSGPETQRSPARGTYEPIWLSAADARENLPRSLHPAWLHEMIAPL
jgi:8-oxo-dGTP pyrophosphatase MutT (NUDIX family)